MAFVFKVNNVDFTDCIAQKGGIKLKKTTFDDENAAGRNMALDMHRAPLGDKRSAPIKCHDFMTQARLKQLSNALRPTYVNITYLDFDEGVVTKKFYCTEIEATTAGTLNGVDYWDGGTFTITEA